METTQKQTEEMIAAMAGPALQPETIAQLTANLLRAMENPADKPEHADSSDQTDSAAK